MLLRFPYKSELENVVRDTKINILTARKKKHDGFARRFENSRFCNHEYVAKNNHVFDFGMFSCAPEVHKSLCFTMHVHDFVNALVKLVLCNLEWS